ncbi:MAG TPA: phosphotransferase [Herpetosiphonaceae bacterium]
MRTPPRLTDAAIRAALYAHYSMSITALTFLPIGNDSASFVYRVDAVDGTSYFLKVRAGVGFSPPSLLIPRFIHEQGIAHIVAPLPTTDGAMWVGVDDFALSLYPFIAARNAAKVGLSDQHWRDLGGTLRQIHTSQLPAELRLMIPQERFIPSRRHVLTQLQPVIDSHDLADPIQRALAAFWRERRHDIHALIERADTLGSQLRQATLPRVLCHADLHTWNVLLDSAQQMWIVDWDEMILAPKERDLMFVIGGIGHGLVSPHETTCFLQGYGDVAIDQRALVYYRYAWAVQDMAAYAEEVFVLPDLGEQDRSAAVDGFIDLFAPGNIVAIARASDSSAL